MFYQLDWQQMEKNWKVICTASFFFIVTHYSRFCSLISASSSLSPRMEKKVAAAAHQRSWFVFLEVCHSDSQQKSNYSWMSPLSSAFQCKDLEIWPPADATPVFNLTPQPQADNQPQRMVSALKSLVVPYLTASPQSQDKVLFSQLTGGWCWSPSAPTRCPSVDAKGHSWSVPPHMETIPITTKGPLYRHHACRGAFTRRPRLPW